MKRKPIRLTGNSYAVLAVLDKCGGGATSYELKQALEQSVENFWQVPHTTAYEEPARLAAAGYLTARQERGGRRRRVYTLTDAGRAALAEWIAEPVAAPPVLRDEGVLKVFAGADPAPLDEGRAAWHRGKLEQLQGYLDALEGAEDAGAEAGRRTLEIGIAYHRKALQALDELAAERAGRA